MANATPKAVASSVEYNKVTANIRDLDARVTPLTTNMGDRGARDTVYAEIQNLRNVALNSTSGNVALSGRLSDIGRQVVYVQPGGGTAQSIPNNGVAHILEFPTVRVPDSTIITASGTNNSAFIVKKAGTYAISMAYRLTNNSAGVETGILINDVLKTGMSGGVIMGVASYNAKLAVNDVIKTRLYHSSAGSRQADSGAGDWSHIAITYLGPGGS
ncbi:hypothetical protein [Amycolatopsis japonica]|nr:hypothetical protein [Amycolatopsis japonica]